MFRKFLKSFNHQLHVYQFRVLFFVETKLIVERFVFGKAFADASNFDTQVKVFELEGVKVELALFGLDSFLCDRFAKELTGM